LTLPVIPSSEGSAFSLFLFFSAVSSLPTERASLRLCGTQNSRLCRQSAFRCGSAALQIVRNLSVPFLSPPCPSFRAKRGISPFISSLPFCLLTQCLRRATLFTLRHVEEQVGRSFCSQKRCARASDHCGQACRSRMCPWPKLANCSQLSRRASMLEALLFRLRAGISSTLANPSGKLRAKCASKRHFRRLPKEQLRDYRVR